MNEGRKFPKKFDYEFSKKNPENSEIASGVKDKVICVNFLSISVNDFLKQFLDQVPYDSILRNLWRNFFSNH